ncbi:hypothetical protein BC938DRAFT_473693 [Jimgerdemannia flammicorona]|uniref:Uncharacterized protein n=1 Tax=Jimgerdemannia flammicorona TaxID=994334 RepID=A0A433Q3R2_9FUNG|nr:hypothetical protein BC938DRAFT_473693 [Jimgerdemannia flammicorona]
MGAVATVVVNLWRVEVVKGGWVNEMKQTRMGVLASPITECSDIKVAAVVRIGASRRCSPTSAPSCVTQAMRGGRARARAREISEEMHPLYRYDQSLGGVHADRLLIKRCESWWGLHCETRGVRRGVASLACVMWWYAAASNPVWCKNLYKASAFTHQTWMCQ